MKTDSQPLDQGILDKLKEELDETIKKMIWAEKKLSQQRTACCNSGLYDQRSQYDKMLAHLAKAKGELMEVRAVGGAIEGGGIVRSGGT